MQGGHFRRPKCYRKRTKWGIPFTPVTTTCGMPLHGEVREEQGDFHPCFGIDEGCVWHLLHLQCPDRAVRRGNPDCLMDESTYRLGGCKCRTRGGSPTACTSKRV